jgi:hypothetical protein
MKKKHQSAVVAGLVVIVVAFLGYINYALWSECLAKNSFFFCMNVIK